MRLIILTTFFLIPFIGHTAFPFNKGELINIEKNNLVCSVLNPLDKADSSPPALSADIYNEGRSSFYNVKN